MGAADKLRADAGSINSYKSHRWLNVGVIFQMRAVFTTSGGYVTDQPAMGPGQENTVIGGQNVIFEGINVARVLRAPINTGEALQTVILAFTASLTAGSPVATFSATANTSLSPNQHVLIGDELFLIRRFTSATTAEVGPVPVTTVAAQAVKKVPKLFALDKKRGSLLHGGVVYVANYVYVVCGDGVFRVDGAALSPALTASTTPQMAYPDGSGGFVVSPVGFTAPAAPVVMRIGGGTKTVAGSYGFALAKKRKGYPGSGLASPLDVQVYAAGEQAQIALPAFDASQGQNQWVVLRTKSRAGTSGLKWIAQVFDTQSTNVTIDLHDNELVEEYNDDNYPPPKALFPFVFENHLCLASCLGEIDATADATAPGPYTATSRLNNPEAFPIVGRSPVQPEEDIIGVHQSSAQAYILTNNRVNYGSLSGSTTRSMLTRPGQAIRIAHWNSAVVAEELLWIKSGPSLIQATQNREIRDQIGTRVASVLRSMPDERTFVGLDDRNRLIVIFCANYRRGGGGKWQTYAISYNYERDRWNPPAILGDGSTTDHTITGVCTVNGELFFATSQGETWKWDAGTGMVGGFLAWPFHDGNDPRAYKRVTEIAVVGNVLGTVGLYRDNDIAGLLAGAAAPAQTLAAAGTGSPMIHPKFRTNFLSTSFALRLSFTNNGGDAILEGITPEYEMEWDFRR